MLALLARALAPAALALLAWALAPAAQAQVDTHRELWSAELTVGQAGLDVNYARGYCNIIAERDCRELNQINANAGFGALSDGDIVRGGVRHDLEGIFWTNVGFFAGDLILVFPMSPPPRSDYANWTLHFGERSFEMSDAVVDDFEISLYFEDAFDSANPPPAVGSTVTVRITGPARPPDIRLPAPVPAPLLGDAARNILNTTLTVGAPEGGAGEAGFCWRDCTYVRNAGSQQFGRFANRDFADRPGGRVDWHVLAITWDENTLEFEFSGPGERSWFYGWEAELYRNVVLFVDDRPFPPGPICPR